MIFCSCSIRSACMVVCTVAQVALRKERDGTHLAYPTTYLAHRFFLRHRQLPTHGSTLVQRTISLRLQLSKRCLGLMPSRRGAGRGLCQAFQLRGLGLRDTMR